MIKKKLCQNHNEFAQSWVNKVWWKLFKKNIMRAHSEIDARCLKF